MATRREFVQKTALGAAGLTLGAKGMATAFNARSYSKIPGANDRIRVGIVGYSDRFRGALSPAFLSLARELNFEFTAVSDLWSLRREAAAKFYKDKGSNLRLARNNDELWEGKDTDAVFVSTPDFSHALIAADAVKQDVMFIVKNLLQRQWLMHVIHGRQLKNPEKLFRLVHSAAVLQTILQPMNT